MAYRASWVLVFALGLWSLSASAQTWSGTVRDIRNLEPLPDSRICAGISGRVDLECTTTDTEGGFVVSYPEGSSRGDDGLWYLFVNPPEGLAYYNQVRARAGAGEAECLLVPNRVNIRARVTDADTGTPIMGMGVALIRVGAIQQTVMSDDAGMVIFDPVTAFANPRLQYNTYGVPEEDLPPEPDEPLVYVDWNVMAPYSSDSQGYARVEPTQTEDRRWDPELELLSSLDPEVFTFVDLRLPVAGTNIDDPSVYLSSQIGAPEPNNTGGTGGTAGVAGATSGGAAGSGDGGSSGGESAGLAGVAEEGGNTWAGAAGDGNGELAGSVDGGGSAGAAESGGSDAAGTEGVGAASAAAGAAGSEGSAGATGRAGDGNGAGQAGALEDNRAGSAEAGEVEDETEGGQAGSGDDEEDQDDATSDNETSTTTATCGCSVPGGKASYAGSTLLFIGLMLSRWRSRHVRRRGAKTS